VKKWDDLGHRQACCVLGFTIVAGKEDERENGKKKVKGFYKPLWGFAWAKPTL